MKFLRTLFFTLLVLFVFSAALAGGKKASIKTVFDHQMHTDSFFTPNNVPCDNCHVKDKYQWKDMNRDGCHDCHNRSKFLDYASKNCLSCHERLRIKPASHRVNWLPVHKTEVKADEKQCKACHNDRFCIKCHEQRDDVKLNMHKRNYRYFHSIDAWADPKKCDRCHVLTFCTNCHSNPRGK